VPDIDVKRHRGKRPKVGDEPEDFYEALMYQ
jgi:hypothetical protein